MDMGRALREAAERCVCMCVRLCVRVRVRVCVCARALSRVCGEHGGGVAAPLRPRAPLAVRS